MPDNSGPVNGWDTWARHVLKEQRRLSDEVQSCHEAVAEQNKEIAELRAALAGYMSRAQDSYHDIGALGDSLTEFKVEISRELGMLQAKSGVWGALGALVVLLVVWLMSQLGG